MVETSELCNTCGSYSVPKGARFCPNCGASVNNSDAVPMVPVVPVAMMGNSSSSCNNNNPVVSTATPVEPSIAVTPLAGNAASSSTTTTSAPKSPYYSDNDNNNNNNNVLPEAVNTDMAMFWKHPSPAMLERACNYHVMGGILFVGANDRVTGKFTVPKTIHIGQILTGNRLDLSRADFVYPVSTILVGTILGGLKLIVPRGVRVETTGFGILGGFKGIRSQTVNAGQVENAPLVILQGFAILGGAAVTVNHDVPPVQVID